MKALRARRLAAIDEVDAAAWDACFPTPDPFVRHAFLAALERHGCVGPATGWTPAHVVLESADGGLAGAAPAYLKTHSWGEFVFDFSWADAAEHAGIAYYPKLVCAIPFTPVTGPRLGAGDPRASDHRQRLAQLAASLRQTALDLGASSLHALFLNPRDREVMLGQDCVERRDLQFHWRNEGYADFDDFLARLKHDRRKKIRRERRRVQEAGLRVVWTRGEALNTDDWRDIYGLYAHTYLERGQRPYLNPAFFIDYGRQAGTPLRIASVHDGTQRVAAAIFAIGGDTLYGRHWGAAARYHSLHFEACYYQGVEYCIAHGLAHFDAGTQGSHKLVRGFAPETTCSAHWFAEPRLGDAVRRAMAFERREVDARQAALGRYVPYRHTGMPSGERPENPPPAGQMHTEAEHATLDGRRSRNRQHHG